MDISYGQFTLWVSVSYVVKSEPSCTSHKPRASYQSWLVRGDLVHGICPHAATQSYALNICLFMNSTDPAFARNATSPLLHVDCLHVGINDQKIAISRVSTMRRTTDHRPLISPQLASARPRKMGWKLNWYFATALNVGFDPSPLQTDDQWSPAASITINPAPN